MARPHPDLDRLLRTIRGAPPGPVLVLGTVDSGKTTLVQDLAAALLAEGPVDVAGADMGQAWLGPPTMMGRARLARIPPDWARVRPERLFFVGDTSPAVDLDLCVETLARLLTEGVEPRARILVDTPGLAVGRLAEAFWRAAARRIGGAAVVGIQSGRELEPVLGPFRQSGACLVTCRPATGVRPRDHQERADFRQVAYARYFRPGRLRWAGRARLRIEPAAPSLSAGLVPGRLVGLACGGRDLALAVVRAVGPKRLGLVTPLVSLAGVDRVRVGALSVDPATGRETRA
jgi:polynucleotide 5'-kinase involved in rRNA processing